MHYSVMLKETLNLAKAVGIMMVTILLLLAKMSQVLIFKLGFRRTYVWLYIKIVEAKKRYSFGIRWYVVHVKNFGFECVSEHWIRNRKKKDFKIYYESH